MRCVLIVQAATATGETVSIISESWHLAAIPRVGERIHLQPSTPGLDQFAYVNSVSHHLASGDYFSTATITAATIMLTANIHAVEYILKNSRMWHKLD